MWRTRTKSKRKLSLGVLLYNSAYKIQEYDADCIVSSTAMSWKVAAAVLQ